MLRAAGANWSSGMFPRREMLKSPASWSAFVGVSRGSWKGAAWGRKADPAEDGLSHDEPLLAGLYGAPVSCRIVTGRRAGMLLELRRRLLR